MPPGSKGQISPIPTESCKLPGSKPGSSNTGQYSRSALLAFLGSQKRPDPALRALLSQSTQSYTRTASSRALSNAGQKDRPFFESFKAFPLLDTAQASLQRAQHRCCRHHVSTRNAPALFCCPLDRGTLAASRISCKQLSGLEGCSRAGPLDLHSSRGPGKPAAHHLRCLRRRLAIEGCWQVVEVLIFSMAKTAMQPGKHRFVLSRAFAAV